MTAKKEGIVDIKGKQYETVAHRVHRFREEHPDWALLTEIVERTTDFVIVRAAISNDTRVIATGHAEEYRSASQINKTSALENAETSAIGRALAALGMGGTEFASANEVQNAVHQQGQPPRGGSALKATPPKGETLVLEPSEDVATVTGTIERVSVKTGETAKGKKWTRYGIQIDGEWIGTFSATIGEEAEAMTGQEVEIDWKQDGEHRTAVALREAGGLVLAADG